MAAIEANGVVEEKLKDSELDESWEALKGTDIYNKLNIQMKVLTPAQQKAAMEYAIKSHKAALAQRDPFDTSGTLQEQKDGSLVSSGGSTFRIVDVKPDMKEPFLNNKGNFTIIDADQTIDVEILDAICAEDIEKLHSLLVKFNKTAESTVAARNEKEKFPLLHWAAVENKTQVLHYLLDQLKTLHGRQFNVDMTNVRGETALQWAVLRGHVKATHVLLSYGADITLGDEKGYTSLHHAAQFGQTRIIAQLLRWMVRNGQENIDVKDNCGRTALHWASYKHHPGTVQFLLHKGADPLMEDFEGLTALHWGALQGDIDVIQSLIHHFKTPKEIIAYLNQKDSAGKTALQLAQEKSKRFNEESAEGFRFRRVLRTLEGAKRICDRGTVPFRGFAGASNPKHLMYDDNYFHPIWLSWPYFGTIQATYMYTYMVPTLLPYAPMAVLASVFLHFFIWYVFLQVQVQDPGYIVCKIVDDLKSKRRFFHKIVCWSPEPAGYIEDKQTDDPESAELLEAGSSFDKKYEAIFPPSTAPNPKFKAGKYYRELYYEVLDKGLMVPVCTSCEIAKPLRSKHDRITDRCLYKFDHYCPWVGSAVARENYQYFYGFCVGVLVATFVWYYDWFLYLRYIDTSKPLLINLTTGTMTGMFLVQVLPVMFCTVYAFVMSAQHFYLITKNLTTNEMVNRFRYTYLQNDCKKGLTNDLGWSFTGNWAEFFGLKAPKKVNYREHYKDLFNGGDPPAERISCCNKTMTSEMAHLQQHGQYTSIAGNDKVGASNINASFLPGANKKQN